MKKILALVISLAVSATIAAAGVGIGWDMQYGMYDHTETDLVGGSAAMLNSYSALWQLIYAGADNAINPVDTIAWQGGAGIADDYVTGDDVVWAQRTIAQGGGTAPEDSTTWDNWMLYVGGTVSYEDLSWNTAGYVYQRVYEGTPSLGSWYYESALHLLDTTYAGGGAPVDTFFIGGLTAGVQPTLQVPEPATMSLLGLGALVMAIRRRRS